MNDRVDGLSGYAKQGRYLGGFHSAFPELANRWDIVGSEYCVWHSRSARLSSLHQHVSGIVSACTEKKVVGVHATAIVASVQYAQPVWDVAPVQHPCNSMGNMDALIDIEDAVTTAKAGLPFPTAASDTFNMPFEPFADRIGEHQNLHFWCRTPDGCSRRGDNLHPFYHIVQMKLQGRG